MHDRGVDMRVLLIATNQSDQFMNRMVVRPLPIGLAYLAAHIDESRHQMRLLDLMFSKDAVADVTRDIADFAPDVIGLSIRNLDNQSYLNSVSFLPPIRDLIGHVKGITDAKVVIGGPAFSILPRECFEYMATDYGVAGHAIESFGALIDRLGEGIPVEDIPGLLYLAGDSTEFNPPADPPQFGKPPRLDLLDVKRYERAGFGLGVVTKLADTYFPREDDKKASGGTQWRFEPVDKVIAEVERLKSEFGIRKVFFIDSGFNVPLEYAKQLCTALIERKVGVRWNSYVRPAEFDDELFDLMARSGCSLALMAANPGDGTAGDADLTEYLARLERLAEACRRAELPFTMNVNFGEPGDDEEAVEQKLAFLESASPAFAVLRIGMRVLPGSVAARRELEAGRIASESDLIEPHFFIEESVKPWIADRLRSAVEGRPRWNLM
jgi:hypothetical protein